MCVCVCASCVFSSVQGGHTNTVSYRGVRACVCVTHARTQARTHTCTHTCVPVCVCVCVSCVFSGVQGDHTNTEISYRDVRACVRQYTVCVLVCVCVCVCQYTQCVHACACVCVPVRACVCVRHV